MIKKAKTVSEKNKDLQNKICHKVAPSKDLTIRPSKTQTYKHQKILNKGPGSLLNYVH